MNFSQKFRNKISFSKRHQNRIHKENTENYMFDDEIIEIANDFAAGTSKINGDGNNTLVIESVEAPNKESLEEITVLYVDSSHQVDPQTAIGSNLIPKNSKFNSLEKGSEGEIIESDQIAKEPPTPFSWKENVTDNENTEQQLDKIIASSFQKLKLTEKYESFMRDWVTEHKGITQHACSSLLAGLKKVFSPLSDNFVIDSRTLMKHNFGAACDHIIEIANGEYCHFGLYDHICMALKDGFEPQKPCLNTKEKTFQISLFIDGLQIHKATHKNFWAILGSVPGAKNDAPFCVGVYYSEKHHPSSFVAFLRLLISDLEGLRNKSFTVNNCDYTFSFGGPIICDTPARCDVKDIKGHSGYCSCDKCIAHGAHIGKIHFPFHEKINGQYAFNLLRTNENFRDRSFPQHHRSVFSTSAFEEIPDVDMVLDFVIDYMHMMCLGVMKKLLYTWLITTSDKRLSLGLIEEIKKKSAILRKDCPVEFINKIRDLSLLKKFKAKEYRAILGYWGITLFKEFLSKEAYYHFLHFSCAFRILASDLAYEEAYISQAEDMLVKFVQDFATVYDEKNIVRNVHSLLHICDDVRRYGPLENFSAFKFESYFGPFKRLLHGPHKPLQQLWNKLMQYKHADKNIVANRKKLISECEFWYPIKRSTFRQRKEGIHFKMVKYPNFSVKTKHPDNVVILKNGKVIVVEEIVKGVSEDGYIFGRKFAKVENLFKAPIQSRILDIGLASLPLSRACFQYKTSMVVSKCIRTEMENKKFAIIPLLHTR